MVKGDRDIRSLDFLCYLLVVIILICLAFKWETQRKSSNKFLHLINTVLKRYYTIPKLISCSSEENKKQLTNSGIS